MRFRRRNKTEKLVAKLEAAVHRDLGPPWRGFDLLKRHKNYLRCVSITCSVDRVDIVLQPNDYYMDHKSYIESGDK